VPDPKPSLVSDEFLLLQEPEVHVPTDTAFSEALAHYALGLSYEMDQDTPAAVKEYLKAIEKDPDNDSLYILATQRLIKSDKKEEAFALLEQLLERNPSNLRALRWLGYLYMADDKKDESLAILKRAVDLHPEMESVYLATIQLLLERRDVDEALAVGRLGIEHAERPQKLTHLMSQLLLGLSGDALDMQTTVEYREEAEALLIRGETEFPEETWFSFKLAELDLKSGQSGKAFIRYHAIDARSDDPTETRARILVHSIQNAGQGDNNVAFIRDYLEHQETDTVLSCYLRGLLNELSRLPELALGSYQEAAEIDPDDQATQRKLAVLYYQNDQPGRAARQLQNVLESKPDDLEILPLAGQLQLAAGNFQQAATHFNKVRILNRQGVEVENLDEIQLRLAMAYLALGREEEAVDMMVPVLQATPEAIEVLWVHQIRLAFDDRGAHPEKAKERETLMLEALMDLSDRLPAQPLIEVYIGTTYNFMGEHSLAIKAFERAEDLANDQETPSLWLTPDFYFEFATSLERSARIEEAMATFEKVIELDPDHDRALNYLAYMWAERGIELEKAEDYVNRALRLDPGNGSYLDTLGWIYYQQGNFTAALEKLEQAAEAEPNESVIIEHLGDVMMKLKRYVEAAGYYRIARNLNPGDRLDILNAAIKQAEDLMYSPQP
jgi:tetratricopeptide (TPR) repeat protein